MSNKRARKRSCVTTATRKYEQNKQNLIDQLDPFENSKDVLERAAQDELNDISEIEFRKIDFIDRIPRNFAEEISGWNHPTANFRLSNFRSSSELKPKSAGKTRILGTRVPSSEGKNTKIRLKTVVETSGDEVLVCKPVLTEPAEQCENSNIVFEHKPVQSLVLTKESKQTDDSSKLYNIIKSIEAENSKLLRKLFREKSLFQQLHQNRIYDNRKSSRNSSRPVSSIRKQRSKQNIYSKHDESKGNTQSVFNFVLCSQKGIMPNSLRSAKPDLKDIKKEALQSCINDQCIFYPTKNSNNKFAFRTKMAANSLCRQK